MLGNTLRYLRKEHNLTQYELGKILNLSQRSISQYELGLRFPDESMINSIADYFNVSVDFLLGRTKLKRYNIKRLNKK